MKVNNQKAAAKNAEQMINEAWAPMITRTTGVKDPEKLAWMSQLAHNTAKSLNESAPEMGANSFSEFGGAYAPYNNLYNTLGVGNVVAPKMAAMTGAQQADDQILGSGDKFPALLPLAMKVAAKTIGFELVNTTPLAGPSGVLPYMDYVYSGSKQPYGATPAYDPMSANPHVYQKGRVPEDVDVYSDKARAAFRLYGLPHAFKATLLPAGSNADPMVKYKHDLEDAGLKAGVTFRIGGGESGAGALVVEFVGWSRIDGCPMFKVVNGAKSLGEYFMDGAVEAVSEIATLKLKLQGPKLVSMLEDSLLGFAGAGDHDEDAWAGTYQDGTVLYEPMNRATGELTPARQISLQLFTKNIAVGTIQVACAVTQEQVTDLQKQWGIDVLKVVENAGVNELSQTINRHITSRLFALGWKNHAKLVEVEGLQACLNMTFMPAAQAKTMAKPAYAIPEGEYDNENQCYTSQRIVEMPIVPMGVIDGANFENHDTLVKRIFTNILAASNWIQQRGRYGAATFVVTNIRVATLIQGNAHYSFSPVENTVKQTAGQLYPIGTVCGLTVYVDPLMSASDTRVLVGRKGGKDEPGTHFCPYVMAETVRIIAEGTMAPKLMIKSRYALIDAGFYPETQYLTFFVDCRGL